MLKKCFYSQFLAQISWILLQDGSDAEFNTKITSISLIQDANPAPYALFSPFSLYTPNYIVKK